MTPLVLVHGTRGRHQPWHQPGSVLWTALEDRGFTVVQFRWSGYCGGVPGPVIVPPDTDEMKGSLELWRSEGEKLALFCRHLGLERPHVISHSHGLQVVAFAASGAGSSLCQAQRFGVVLSLSGPVRDDMAQVRQQARSNIAKWIQVTDTTGDDKTVRDPNAPKMIIEGELFDGHAGWDFHLPEADLNIDAPHQGHSGLTTDIDAWEPLGIWRELAV